MLHSAMMNGATEGLKPLVVGKASKLYLQEIEQTIDDQMRTWFIFLATAFMFEAISWSGHG